jgi:hypothetical protein
MSKVRVTILLKFMKNSFQLTLSSWLFSQDSRHLNLVMCQSPIKNKKQKLLNMQRLSNQFSKCSILNQWWLRWLSLWWWCNQKWRNNQRWCKPKPQLQHVTREKNSPYIRSTKWVKPFKLKSTVKCLKTNTLTTNQSKAPETCTSRPWSQTMLSNSLAWWSLLTGTKRLNTNNNCHLTAMCSTCPM